MAIESFIDKFGGWTESYFFYNGDVELRYDPKDHVYLLVTPEGLEKQDGVTTVVHIIDKSDALVPWGCKMMYQKLLRTMPFCDMIPPDSDVAKRYTMPMTFEEFDKIAHEAKNAHTEKLEEAGEIGHVAHAWIESYIKLSISKKETPDGFPTAWHEVCEALQAHLAKLDDSEKINEKSASCCRAALDWMQKHNVRWHSTERKIYSRKYKYAGTMDGLCTCDSCDDPKCCPVPFKDHLTVADWKTSNYLYLEYLYQTAAYMQAYNEEEAYNNRTQGKFTPRATDRWVIRLGKEDGEFEPWHCNASTTENDIQGFIDCLDLVRRVRNTQARISERKADLRAALKVERDAARAVKEALEKAERAEAKAKRQQERLEALQLACGASKKYKGSRKPSCKAGKDGGPCVACAFKYAKAQEKKPVQKQSNVGAFPHKEIVCLDGMTTEVKNSIKPKPDSEKLQSLMAVLVPRSQPILLPASSGLISAPVEPTTQPQSVAVDDRIPYEQSAGIAGYGGTGEMGQ